MPADASKRLCYACGGTAVSDEHVPPLCIFPEEKDLPERSRRRNLIKVPACDEHNLRKSRDDEYLMMVLTCHFRNNDIARRQFETKIIRAWERKPHLAAMALRNLRPAFLDGHETASFQVDLNRFDRSMNLIAKGLCFHHTGSVWPLDFQVWGTTLLPPGPEVAKVLMDASDRIAAAADQILGAKPRLGENQDALWYQIHTPASSSETSACVRLVFYSGIEVFCWSPGPTRLSGARAVSE